MGDGVISNDVATDVLVMMIVAVNQSWKIPVGHFFITGLSGMTRAKLVKDCLQRCQSANIHVVNVTCDGPTCNMSMLKCLGVSLDPYNFKPWIKLSESSEKVHVLLDPVHMLKLIRNSLGELRVLKYGHQLIKWEYIVKLNDMQNRCQMLVANKLSNKHINYHTQKMKVRLAVQTLSNSVADAIDYCRDNLGLEEFAGSEATTEFIRIFDKTFDLFNSRSYYGKDYKAAMTLKNYETLKQFMDQARDYILQLQLSGGNSLITSRRKTGFLGFLLDFSSVQGIFEETVLTGDLKYLLTYKLSQDHLETYFGGVRAKNGTCDNPTTVQFKQSMQKLFLKTQGNVVKGENTILQDETELLHIHDV